MTRTVTTYRCPTCDNTIGLTIRPLELPLCTAKHPEGRRRTHDRLMMPDAGQVES